MSRNTWSIRPRSFSDRNFRLGFNGYRNFFFYAWNFNLFNRLLRFDARFDIRKIDIYIRNFNLSLRRLNLSLWNFYFCRLSLYFFFLFLNLRKLYFDIRKIDARSFGFRSLGLRRMCFEPHKIIRNFQRYRLIDIGLGILCAWRLYLWLFCAWNYYFRSINIDLWRFRLCLFNLNIVHRLDIYRLNDRLFHLRSFFFELLSNTRLTNSLLFMRRMSLGIVCTPSAL